LKRTEKYLNNFDLNNPIKYCSEITNSKSSLLDRSLNYSRFQIKPDKISRIKENIEINKILDLEPLWMDKMTHFRSRSVEKEIQKEMNYRT